MKKSKKTILQFYTHHDIHNIRSYDRWTGYRFDSHNPTRSNTENPKETKQVMRYNAGKYRYDGGYVYRMVWIFPVKLLEAKSEQEGIKLVNELMYLSETPPDQRKL